MSSCLLQLHSFSFIRFETTLLAWLDIEASRLTFRRIRREALEHLGYALVQLLFILRRFVGQRIFRATAPDQLFGVAIVEIQNQISFLVVLLGGGSLAHSSEASPAPSAAYAVIERIQCSLGMSRLNRYDRHIAA